jgi:hypothetical protein
MTGIRTSVIAMICAIVAHVTCADAATTGTKNLCPNGRFEHLQEAAASRLPQAWSSVRTGKSPRIEIVEGSEKGRRALRISAQGIDIAGMNSDVMAAERGVVRFRYKAQGSGAEGVNLGMYVLGFVSADG